MMASSARHDVFQAIADPTRRRLLKLLSGEEMPVTAISEHFPISRTAVSKHLRVLADAGLVQERKVGRETRYKLEPKPLYEVTDWLRYFEIFWENKLAALRQLVESNGEETKQSERAFEVIENHSINETKK
ncbi:winged helix-turn-helix transcriptional regulator [Bacillus sp. BRMEA1]|uniref:ArsR/SmtB family transcription factor n=1 Tax=Neobacillus endophyticus TaxID=2738405 RepID=UPI0015666404|nr:metalloregulator ArsR/SmtB family transcription factor [Neobacillus endophyticus]NRD76172.1 winged helix-turn-helix transcriptional regulator [Neobacillus endophyticus]